MSESSEILQEKRVAKCAGCKTPLEEHHWGIPSKFCEGIAKSSPKREPKDNLGAEGCSLESLRAELEALDVEEQILRRKTEEEQLKEQIAAKRKAIQQLSRPLQQEDKTNVLTSRDLPRLPSDNPCRKTPLDDLLASAAIDMDPPPPAAVWFQRQNPSQRITQPSPVENQASTGATEMFLKPRTITKGEKPLLIVDFVTNIVPQDEEETLGNQGNAKIVVTYGPKKPKLETVTLPQWVIANTRIFYTLLSQGKLANQATIQHYLTYTVKIMELSSKYDWKSILLYDNEFRNLQAVYNLPWSFDSNHLHTVMLQPKANQYNLSPKQPPTPNPNPRSTFANFTSDGRVICRNFNGQKGCMLHSCNFAHVCNRKVAGKACGLSHPGISHKLAEPQNTH